MENIEIEYKVMVNKNDFEKLIRQFNDKDITIIDQTNYYYDNKNCQIKNNKMSLRIRQIDNTFCLTLKESLKDKKIEHEFFLKENKIHNMPYEVIDLLASKGIDYKTLFLKGSLRTIRYQTKYKDCLLCLDHSFYNNIEDFEIELETVKNLDYAKEILTTLLDGLHISYTPTKFSKNARALNATKDNN